MTTAALTVALAVLVALLTMQMLLIAGFPLGKYAWGGGNRVLPPRMRVAAGAAIGLYLAFGALLCSRAGVLPGRDTGAVVIGTGVLFGYCALSVVPNLISRSRAERVVQTPVSVVLSVAVLVLALG